MYAVGMNDGHALAGCDRIAALFTDGVAQLVLPRLLLESTMKSSQLQIQAPKPKSREVAYQTLSAQSSYLF